METHTWGHLCTMKTVQPSSTGTFQGFTWMIQCSYLLRYLQSSKDLEVPLYSFKPRVLTVVVSTDGLGLLQITLLLIAPDLIARLGCYFYNWPLEIAACQP